MATRKHIGDIRIGISGWNYAGWRGVFYPPKLAHKRELAYASSVFRTIEINGTHYSLQRPEDFARWAEETPDDFIFAVKGSRYITHMMKLRTPEAGLANFFAQGLLRLGRKLGPIPAALPAAPGSRSIGSASCATRWKFGTKASSIPISSRYCANTASL